MNCKFEANRAGYVAKPADETPPPPFSSRLNVDLYGLTDKGHVHSRNEDHFLIVRAGRAVETVLTSLSEDETMPGELFEETGYGMIVAAGGGDAAAGEGASRQAVYTFLSLALHTPDWQFRWGAKERNTVMWRMRDRFRRVNTALLRDAAVQASQSGLCTTITAAVTHGIDLIVGHIGNSRAYLLHNGKLVKLTRDHTFGQSLNSSANECSAEVHDYLLADDDQLLLCTGGLTHMVNDMDIEMVLNNASSAKSACRDLVDMALNNGGRDNVTAVVARYSIPARS